MRILKFLRKFSFFKILLRSLRLKEKILASNVLDEMRFKSYLEEFLLWLEVLAIWLVLGFIFLVISVTLNL